MIEDIEAWQGTDELSAEQREIFERLLAEDDIELEEREPIPRRRETGEVPLSFAQQRLWILQQLDPASSAYNMPSALRMEGRLDRPALAASLEGIVRRHESLRTTFHAIQGRPVQVIAPEACIELPLADLSGIAPGRRHAQLEILFQAEARRPFDLEAGPMLRALLIELDGEEHILLLTLHHIASDGWSTGVLIREVGALYEAHRAGRPAALPELPIQYADFAVWQRQWLSGEVLEGQLAYWREQLAGVPPVLDLPTDRPRPAARRERGGVEPVALPADLLQGLKAIAWDHDATLFIVLLAGFAALLQRYTGQEGFAVGTPIAGRNRAETEGLIGFFVNTLVMRADLSGDPSFLDLVRRVRETALEAYAHQDLPFERLIDELKPVRDLSRTPLFQVMFVLQNTPSGALELEGLRLEALEVKDGTAKFDLMLAIGEQEGALAGSIEYDSGLFDRSTVSRMVAHLHHLLAGAVAAPALPVSLLPLQTEAERHHLLAEYNDTAAGFGADLCLHDRIERQAALSPDAVAVVFEGSALSYGDLDARANRLGRHLRRLGVGAETVVGICAERSVELMIGLLGILKAGGAYLPLDPSYPPERLAFMVDDGLAASGRPVLLLQGRFAPLFTGWSAGAGARRIDLDRLGEELAGESGGPLEIEAGTAGSDNAAYVIYTSGSTGRPKGVVNTHRGISNRLLWMQAAYRLGTRDVVLQKTPVSFDVSVWELFWPLMTGARLVLARPDGHRDSAYLADLIEEQEVTTLHFVPSMLQVFLEEPDLGRCASLRQVMASGEALPSELARRFLASLGAELHNLYGPTEAAVDVTYHACRSAGVGETPGVPIGRPISNLGIWLLDRGLQPVPLRVPGELYIGGVGLARGYLNRPDLTAERFVPHPASALPGERLYRTGDLARFLPGGEIEFLGRTDHQVKIRGFRVELGEIEAALLELPGVREAVVMSRQDRLVAYVVGDVAADELRRSLRERLPGAMVPSAFVPLAALPLTPNGKVDRKALSAGAAPAPVSSDLPPEEGRSALEEALAGIWCEVLGVPRVGSEENFFDLGGHSLLLPQVKALLRNRLGREVKLLDLLTHATVRSLALHLEPAPAVGEPAPLRAAEPRTPGSGAVAIVGLAGRFPGAPGVKHLWENLRAGVASIARFNDEELAASGVPPELRRDPRYVPAAGVLDGVELFDAGFFGYSPREAELLDPQQRLFLECAWQALEDAGYDSLRVPGPVGVFSSLGYSRYLHQVLSADPTAVGLQLLLGNDKDFLSTRVSYKLDLAGPSMTVQTACSSSLVGVHLACQNLLLGACDMALAGGVSIGLPERAGYLYEEGGISSPDGLTRAFDAEARGAVGGSGVGVVVLKRLEDALADGDTIHAVLLGSAVNNDGSSGKAGYTAPSIAGQAKVISAALAAAGVSPESISYVEAHGTATPLGDPIEVAALTQAFRGGTDRTGFCLLGSVKTNVGHLDAAAGVTGLIKTALALEHRQIPPSLHFQTPNPVIDFAASPFRVADRLTDWPANGEPRRAGVSAFGLGGTNAHVVLEEAPPAAPSAPSRPWQMLLLAARTPSALERMTDGLADRLEGDPDLHLADAAYTLRVGRRPFAHRRAVLASTREEAVAALRERDPQRVWTAGREADRRSVAFLLPGVGDQYPGLARGLYHDEPAFRQEFDRCAELLVPHLGLDLREVLFSVEETEEPSSAGTDLRALLGRGRRGEREPAAQTLLRETRIAQPAMFAVGHALARLWMSWGVRPAAFLGYSLGEYTAACLAGVMELPDALALVARRARLIGELAPGALLAVPLSEQETRAQLTPELSLAAVNAPAVSVVSGPPEAVAGLERRLSAEGFPCRRLQADQAFHSWMMRPIAGELRELLRAIRLASPRIPYLSNVTGTWISPDQATDPDYWVSHLVSPVRFADGVAELWREPGRILLEMGPGQTLGSLALQQVPADGADRAVFSSLRHELDRQPDQRFLLQSLGRLWLSGAEIDWSGFHAGERRRRVPLPAYPFERQRYWIEPKPAAPLSAPAASGVPERLADVADWFHTPSWKRTPRLRGSAPGPLGGRWLVLLDSLGLGDRLVGRLTEAGCEVATVQAGQVFSRIAPGRYTLDPHASGDFGTLFSDLGAVPDRILHLWSLGSAEPLDTEEALARGYHALVSLAQELARRKGQGPAEICVIANGLCDVLWTDPLHPEKATLFGPLRVIPQEHPRIACRLIDVDAGEIGTELGDRLLAELTDPVTAQVVSWRGPHRWSPMLEPAPLAPAAERPTLLKEGGTYLITGGLGGLGLGLADQLARTVGARLVLTSRSALPDRELWPERMAGGDEMARRLREVQALEAAGFEVLVVSADVADAAAMRNAVETARRRFGRIDGVFHTAGVPGAGLLQLKTRETAELVLEPKVQGTLVLESVLGDDPPDFLVLFSSLNAVVGGIGQVDYSAANAFLGVFARSRSLRTGTRVIAIDWCEWRWNRWTDELIADPGILEALRRRREILGLTFAEGMEAIGRILESGLPEVVVSTFDLLAAIEAESSAAEAFDEFAEMGGPSPGQKAHPRPALQTPWAAPSTETEVKLTALWEELLGIAPIGVHDDFFQLGGHSLLGLQVVSRIQARLGVELPLAVLFEAPTVAELAVRVEEALQPGARPLLLPPLVPLAPALREGQLPLSFAQQRLWFIEQLEPGRLLYHISVALRSEGRLDPAVLALCLGEVVRRHEAVRTVFAEADGSPVQVIRPAAPFSLPVVDLSGLPADRREPQALALAGEESNRPFDLARGPLLRGVLLRLAGEDHIAALTMHHIVSDGWSMGILVSEVTALYGAFAEGRPSPLPELPVQYADFAAWQASWLHGEVLEREISFWRRQLAGLPPLLELPTDRPRPAIQSFRGASRPVRLPAELSRPAGAMSRREGATLFMVLLAGFQALLARYSGQGDFAVGSPAAGRNQVEIEDLIGFFVNTLVIRGNLSGEPSFRELLGRVRETTLAAHMHQDVPFERLVQELSPERSLAYTPLFQVMLVLQNIPVGELEIRGLRLRPTDVTETTARFDLTLSLGESDSGMEGGVYYSTALFDEGTIDRLIGHFERLLAAAVATPDLSLSELPLLSSAELQELVQQAGRSGPDSPSALGLCVHELFAEQAARTPEALAVVDEERAWTYAELYRRVRQLALRLRGAGVGPDQPVILCAERGAGLVTGLLGILEAGGAYLAVEPDLPPARQELLARDAQVAVAVTESRLADTLPAGLRRILLDREDSGDLEPAAGRTPPAAAGPDHLAYVLYTSGSTGQPKGVMVEHRQLAAYVRGVLERLAPPPGASFATVSSFAADLGHTSIFAALLGGGCLHVVARERLTDAGAFAELMERRPVDVLKIVPSHLAALLTAERPERSLPRRLLILGGEALPWSLVDEVRALAPECRLFNHYGPTETTVGVLAGAVEETGGRGSASVPLGGSLGLSRVWIVDRHLRLLPAGVPGELCAGGPQVTRGYLGRPDLTAERFIPDPFGGGAGERLYRTGDLVRRRPGGSVEFLGRIDHQVKIRGFRIELGEIEAALVASPAVNEALVTVREDTPGDRRLIAYVVGDIAAEALRQSLRERLPDYMVPAAFVTLAALPLTPNGKVDRKALPAPEQQHATESYRAPRTLVEELLAGIWAELLGIERVGVDDSFFDLGGHSLLATRVMSRLRSAFEVEMPLRDLFEAPTLVDFAVRVEAARQAGTGRLAPPLVPVPRQGPSPLSFAQQRLWFIDQLEPGRPLYNLPLALRIEGPLDCGRLALCLDAVVRRHEALRTVFAAPEGVPVQVVQPPSPFVLPVVDLSGLPEGRREAAALTLSGEEAVRSFDLTRGPLLRGLLLRLAPGDHAATLTMHHIVSDGWSRGILIHEVTALYAAFAEGRPSFLPALPVQYADFAVWQHTWLHGEVLESEISYWRRQLAGLPPRLELPTDRPRPAVQSFRGATRSMQLSPELTRQIEILSRREGLTVFIVLLAAFQTLLARYSRQLDLAVGTPVAGRNQMEIEGLIGFFVNTLVLRGDLAGEPSFSALLGRVREAALAAHRHQHVPFEKLVEELSPERSLSQTPFFQVMFGLQNAPAEILDVQDLHLRSVTGAGTTAKFDLTFLLEEWNGGLSGSIEYATDLFDAATIERLILHYEQLLTAAVAAPELMVAELPLLNEAERHQLWVEWNDTEEDPARADRCLHELFAAQAAAVPERVALLSGEEALTYGELDRRANRLARYLLRHGAGPGTLVGVCLPACCETVIALLAILRAGGAYVPLDPAYPAERLALLVESTPLVITREETREKLPPQGVRRVCVDTEEREIARESAAPVEGGTKPGDIAYIIYTSGSTGRPKGVVIDHRGAVNTLLDINSRFGVGLEDRVLALSSLSFDLSVYDIFGLLAAGGAAVLPGSAEHREPALWSELLVRHQISIWNTVPALVEMLVEHAASRPGFAAPALRLVMMSGDWIPVSLPDRIHGLGAGLEIISMGGATEASIWSILYPIGRVEPGWPSIPYGRPMVNQTFHVLDDALEPQPIGVPGQLFIGGIGVALEYWGDEQKTRASFVRHPVHGERLYRTGDLGRRFTDGTIEFLGRVDHQVKVRGFRIELGDIEAALAPLAGVREALVTVREDTPGDRRLVAYVIGDAEPETLRQALQERLPNYMVPAAFVTLAAFPLTANGKVDRQALPAPEWQSTGESYLAPRTPVEELLAGIWSDLLGLEQVGVDESFFELGGHSLLATRMVSQLRDTLRLEVPLRTVFEAPTLAGLAQRVAELQSERVAEAMPIRPVPRDGELPLSYAQQRLWFLDRMVPDNPFYNIYNPVELSGPMDIEALRRSFEEIVRRHEVLRTTFGSVEDRPVQVIAPAARLDLPLIDLQRLSAAQRRRELSRLSREEGRRPFNLSRGPMLRLHVVRTDPERHALLVTVHHIAADGWSVRVLIDELTVLYEAFLEGRPSPLPELPIQYADFSVWQRQWFQGEVFQEQLGFWKNRLTGLVETPLELPTDHPRPPVETFRGRTELFRLGAPLVRELSARTRRHQATLFMAVLSGFKLLLSRYSGQQDIGIGTGIANRNRQEIEELIGFFVNTLVLRTDLSGLPSFEDLLLRVRETTVEAYDHQDLPFEMLIEEINPERSMNRHPLVQVMLAFQNFPRSARSLHGLSLAGLEGELAQIATAKFDMSLFVAEQGEDLALALQYSTDLFEEVTIRRMLGHLERLLEAAAERPETPVAELPLLSPAEQAQTLREWSDMEKPCPQVPLVHELFAEHARLRPQAPAVTSWDGGRFTYGEVEARANRLAHHLRSLGVGPEVRVAVAAERTCERVVGIVAVLKAGGAYVTLDPAYPKERLAWLLADAGAPVLLTQRSVRDQLAETRAAVICLDGNWESIVGREDRAPASGVMPENLAYVVYTSGSTGKPKGVEIPHAGLMNLVRWHRDLYRVMPEDRGTQIASPAFDASIWELWPYLASGASVHIPDEETRLSPRGMIRWWAEQRITLAYLMTPLAEGVLEEEIPPGLELPTRALIIGGDRLHRGPLPGVGFRLMNHYGPAEYSVTSTVVEVPTRGEASGIPTIGRAVDNTLLYVLDRRSGQPMPAGVPGELYVAGVGLARGYSGRPELTAEKFLPDPFAEQPGSRMYRTGDLVKWLPDGDLDFLGRLDHQVKIRGFRIELGEIETVLAEHPVVAASAVLAQQEPAGQTRLVAYVVYDREGEALAGEVASSQSQQVVDWQTLYENTYERGRSAEEASFNIVGWDSSYTRELIPAGEMLEWTERTVDEILALAPKRVLEIGVGTGLLLYRIAPLCELYRGTDFSHQVISWLSEQLGESMPQVELARRTADDFSGIPPRSFDTVILNSVVQYFPEAGYLAQVLAGAVEAVADGGAVYVGDVRSLPLLEAFHASVELFKADPALPMERLRQVAAAQRLEETELVLDPGFFFALRNRLPRITAVEVRPKIDRADNELTRFRYQVVLRVGCEFPVAPALPWLDWEQEGLSLAEVRRRLALGLEGLAFTRVPNVRVEEAVTAARALAGAGVGDGPRTAGELRDRLDRLTPAGVHPEDLLNTARDLGYEAILSWARPGAEGRFDVLFRRPQASGVEMPGPAADGPWSRFANNPLLGKLARRLTPVLRSYLEERLPAYMVPSAFVLLDELPLTPNGKVDRRALPAIEAARLDGAATPPRTSAEEKLAAVFREVLQIERLGVEDNFFNLGGHSLLATRLIPRVREAFGVELPLRTIFEHPVLADLAIAIEALQSASSAPRRMPIRRADHQGPLPLSWNQQRFWFLYQLNPASSAFNMMNGARLLGRLHAEILEASFGEIVRRHSAVRARFVTVEGVPHQIVDPPGPFSLPRVDLSGLGPDERDGELRRVVELAVQQPFDLERGPLLRPLLLRLADDDHVILFCLHHIAGDGWSFEILIQELGDLYTAWIEGGPSPLSELPIQYADWVVAQQEWLRGPGGAEQLAYWRRQLGGDLPVLTFPMQRQRPSVRRFRGSRQPVTLDAPLSAALADLGRSTGSTLFMCLLAAFKSLLHLVMGAEDLLVGSHVANREWSGTERLIGLFVNDLALRTDLSGRPSFREVLARVRETALEAYAHQDLPFEALQAELRRERSAGPLFQVLFMLQNAPVGHRELPGLTLAPIPAERRTANFDFTLNLTEGADGIQGAFIYDVDLFEAPAVARLAEQFVALLREVVSDPDRPLASLSLTVPAAGAAREMVAAFLEDL